MREFIATYLDSMLTKTVKYNDAEPLVTHAPVVGEIMCLGKIVNGSVSYPTAADIILAALKSDGTDAIAKANYGIQLGVVAQAGNNTNSVMRWSGWIPNNPSTLVTKCLPTAAVAAVKVYTIANTYYSVGDFFGIIMADLSIPYYMTTKREKIFDYQIKAADITTNAINSTGWTNITNAFNAKFSGKYTMSAASGANFTITASAGIADFNASGTYNSSVIDVSSVTTANVNAFNSIANLQDLEKKIQTRIGYNPFWEMDATMWTSPSMIALTNTYTTYVIDYYPGNTEEQPLALKPLHSKRQCILALPTFKFVDNSTANPDVTAFDAIFTALATGINSNAVTGSAPSTVGAAATQYLNTGLIFRTV